MKFRIYDRETGLYYYSHEKDYTITLSTIENGLSVYINSEDNPYGIFGTTEDRFILQRATGKRDITGRDIYEGDIVEYEGIAHEVIFMDGAFFIQPFNDSYLRLLICIPDDALTLWFDKSAKEVRDAEKTDNGI